MLGLGLSLPAVSTRPRKLRSPAVKMTIPDLPTSLPNCGFVITGLTLVGSRIFAADGVGRHDQDTAGPNVPALVELSRTGNTLALVAYRNLSEIMLGLYEDGVSATGWTAGTVAVDTTVYSIQGVSYRADVGMIAVTAIHTASAVTWVVLVNPTGMVRSSAVRVAFATNAFEADRTRGNYFSITAGNQVRRRSFATLASGGLGSPFFFPAGVILDHGCYEGPDKLHLTSGANGVPAVVYTVTTPADMGAAALVSTWAIPEILAIEGVAMVSAEEALFGDDARYHKTGAVNAIWSVRRP